MGDNKKNKTAATVEEVENEFESNGLLYNILHDGLGISVHRFQAVLFNLVFCFTFLNHFFQMLIMLYFF